MFLVVFARVGVFVLSLVIVCFDYFPVVIVFGCQYQCSQLPGKTRL